MVSYRVLVPVLGGVLVAANGEVVNSGSLVLGVEPSEQESYLGDSEGNWSCLGDPSIVLNASQINDGICDCPDGSDEPGTGACGSKGPSFYCQNEGFIPRRISQSKVGDGVCDCCDCSDELLSPVEPYYRGSQCSELQEAFERIKRTELKKHEEGSKVLRNLYLKFQLEDETGGDDKELLSQEIDKISSRLVDCEMALSSLKAKHAEQMRVGNPLLYQFEELDPGYIASEVSSSFERVIAVSKAYEGLIKILDSLRDGYSRSLNDKVVNENVKKYEFLRTQGLKKVSSDSKVEEEQRGQLDHYFRKELPQMFSEGKINKPSKYIIGKITFVESMVFGKVNYVPVVTSKITQLSALMSDIAENYNVNYQDAGVKDAVESYKHWLSQYQTLDTELVLPVGFVDKFNELRDFIAATADQILTTNSGEQKEKSLGGVLQHFNFLRRKVAEFCRPDFTAQISARESTVQRLKGRLDTKREQYHLLESKEKGEDAKELETLKQLIAAHSHEDALTNIIDNYVYQINFNGPIYQIENTPTGNQVKIGDYKSLHLQKENSEKSFFDYLKSTYPDEDDLFPALVSETDVGHEEYLFGDLHETSNGLVLEYSNGDRCWNGPLRSAQVKVRCAKNFQICKVYEMTKCNYGIEMTGPIGCHLL